MSDFSATLLILATFGLMMICLVFVMMRGHLRMDEIVSGVANGVPINTKYRSVLLFYDFWAYVLVGTILLIIFATGFHEAADMAANPSVGAVANFCAIACAGMAATSIILCLALSFYMGSVLRQAEAD